jgi:hypothetical protein
MACRIEPQGAHRGRRSTAADHQARQCGLKEAAMLLKRQVTRGQVAVAVLGLALASMAMAAPGRELLLAFGGGALFAWLFMRLVSPLDSTRNDAQAERAWQDTEPGPYSE